MLSWAVTSKHHLARRHPMTPQNAALSQFSRISCTTKGFKAFRFNTEHPTNDVRLLHPGCPFGTSPERAPHAAGRLPAEASAKAGRISPQVPPSNPNVLYQIQSPRISFTTKDFKSFRINRSKKLPHFSHLIENTQLQVLWNQHLRVLGWEILWIQHLHKNRGGGVEPPANSFIQ